MSQITLERVAELYVKEEKALIENWMTLLRFPSVSTDKSFDEQCTQCAEWVSKRLKEIGFQSEVISTIGKPVVFAERKGESDRPTILVYAHYDVQPADPLNEWKSKPFEPEIRDGKLYARGAADNKGQATFILGALETLIKEKALKANIKVIIEGEEESGSTGLSSIVEKLRDKISADVLVVSDTSMLQSGAPTITMGLRGVSSFTINLNAYPNDLHSGLYGGAVKNPLTELAKIIASFHEQNGKISVKGFYDDLRLPSKKESLLAETGASSDADYFNLLGSNPSGGEQGLTSAQRVGFRPTIEINGLHGGYAGPGGKTIIPASAFAKVSMRLGTDQDPARVFEVVKKHIEERAAKEMRLSFVDIKLGSPALRVDVESKWLKVAIDSLSKLSDMPIAYRWEGGSIPVISELCQVSGAEPLLVGFSKAEDNWHAPNESLALDRFRQGFLYHALLFSQL